MPLETYHQKRDFERTPEPAGDADSASASRVPAGVERGAQFVIHMHDATRLHYDVRLELDGVLKCWAVPKGPSLDPKVKRLAVETEDHPLQYLSFEGVIPEGEYGGGPMLVWDRGLWFPEGDARAGYAKGHLRFRMEGEKVRGNWSLIKTGGRHAAKSPAAAKKDARQWMLIKHRDAAAASETVALVDARPESVRTGRDIATVFAAGVDASLRDVVPAGEPSSIPRAVKAAWPRSIELQLATAVSEPPAGAGWIAEVKLDGYRLLATRRADKVRLVTRGGQDWTERFPGIAGALRALPVDAVMLDGEAVVLDAAGKSDFGGLQQAIGRDDARIALVAFDCLHLDGWDLRAAPLVARKEALRLLVARARATQPRLPIHYSDHVADEAVAMHREACKLGLEGTVAKRADAPYSGGRSRAWLKIKCFARQELVVVGFTEPKGGRESIGALLLGVHEPDGGALRYAGKVGTGFAASELRALRQQLGAIERASPPVTAAPKARDIHWVEPRLVAEVAFREWTKDGVIRQSTFVGMRDDKSASDVTREIPVAVPVDAASGTAATPAPTAAPAKPRAVTQLAGVRITHPDKVMFPDPGITKLALAEYYLAVAPLILPYLADRPLSLVRCPDGVTGSCFYQKHAKRGVPAIVRRVPIPGEDEPYLVIDDVDSLLSLVHFGVIELHVWGAPATALDVPDLLVMDLDPAPDVAWTRVARTALALRDQLAALGLAPFLRSTGGKGLHVVAPLAATATWDEVRQLSLGLATALAQRDPAHYTTNMAKDKRGGRIFVDYLRNMPGSTAVAPWSVRARQGAPVAVPIAWDALDVKHGPPQLGVREVRALVDAPGFVDPWADFHKSHRRLTRAILDAVASLQA